MGPKQENPGLAPRDRGFVRWRGLVAAVVAIRLVVGVAVIRLVVAVAVIVGRSRGRREHRAERSNGREGQNGLAEHFNLSCAGDVFLTSCRISRSKPQAGSYRLLRRQA